MSVRFHPAKLALTHAKLALLPSGRLDKLETTNYSGIDERESVIRQFTSVLPCPHASVCAATRVQVLLAHALRALPASPQRTDARSSFLVLPCPHASVCAATRVQFWAELFTRSRTLTFSVPTLPSRVSLWVAASVWTWCEGLICRLLGHRALGSTRSCCGGVGFWVRTRPLS